MSYENFSHVIQIGIIVKNAERTAEQLRTILNWEPWGIWETSKVPGRVYHNIEEDFSCKMIFYSFSNIEVEIIEPLQGKSCWKDFSNHYGEGIHHLLFDIDNSVQTEAELSTHGIIIEQRGCALPYGNNVYWEYVTSQEQLGFVMELTNRREYPILPKSTKLVQGDFSNPVQVGIVVRNIENTMKHLENILGWQPYRLGSTMETTERSYRGNFEDFYCKAAFYRLPNIEVELIQPIRGRSCWQDFLDERGEGIHHLLFPVNNRRVLDSLQDHNISFLQKGVSINDGRKVSWGYLDTRDLFGFQMEIVSEYCNTGQ